MSIPNMFSLPQDRAALIKEEQVLAILKAGNGLLVERIVSHGQTTPAGSWYDQEKDEWVMILEGAARLSFFDGSEARLTKGDSLLLPAHRKHRVEYTSSPCIWLAIHGYDLAKAESAAEKEAL